MSPKPPPWRENIAPRTIIIHPDRFRIIGTSGPSESFGIVFVGLVFCGTGSALVNRPSDDFLFGLTSALTFFSSVDEAVFALSNNPLIGLPLLSGLLV